MNQKTAWKWIRELLLIILGNALTASASAFFIVPNDLVVGGTTGIGALVGQFFPHIKVSFVVFVLNVFLFLLGFLFLGKKFALTTLLGTFLFPGFIAIFEFMIGNHVLTEDKMLASLMSGLLIGQHLDGRRHYHYRAMFYPSDRKCTVRYLYGGILLLPHRSCIRDRAKENTSQCHQPEI